VAETKPSLVIPAKAGLHSAGAFDVDVPTLPTTTNPAAWIPAFAGMTRLRSMAQEFQALVLRAEDGATALNA
jgi:hypothetical protein